ncbi:MAG: PilZ domain-containing protein [Planctomycetota bacterium]
MSTSGRNEGGKPLEDLLEGAGKDFLDKRRFERLDVETTIDLIPLRPEGLQFQRARHARTRNISRGGVGLVLDEPPLEPKWAVRLDLGEKSALLEIAVRHLHRKEDGLYYLSCQFVRRLDEPTNGN